MTEDEAKTKWCPFSRAESVLDGPGYPAINRNEKGPDSASHCIASACMAWRWFELAGYWKGQSGYEYPVKPPEPAEFVPAPARGGFCGLAGQP